MPERSMGFFGSNGFGGDVVVVDVVGSAVRSTGADAPADAGAGADAVAADDAPNSHRF